MEGSLLEARQKIDALDLEPVISRMMYVHYWPRKNAEQACAQYRNYLYLCKKHMSQYALPPSYEIMSFGIIMFFVHENIIVK